MITYLDQTWCATNDCATKECVRNPRFMDHKKYMEWSKSIGEDDGGPIAFSPLYEHCTMYLKVVPKEPEETMPDVVDFTKGREEPPKG